MLSRGSIATVAAQQQNNGVSMGVENEDGKMKFKKYEDNSLSLLFRMGENKAAGDALVQGRGQNEFGRFIITGTAAFAADDSSNSTMTLVREYVADSDLRGLMSLPELMETSITQAKEEFADSGGGGGGEDAEEPNAKRQKVQ